MENKPTMLSYINEEQAGMLKILESYPNNVDEIVNEISKDSQEWLALGTGSSINAMKSAKYYMEKMAQLRIDIQEPYNYCNYETINPHLDLVLGISQSGQSTSTIAALEKIKQQSTLTSIAVTSIPDSEITAATTLTLDVGSGKERVGYVTLGYVATVLSLMLLGLRLGVKKVLFLLNKKLKKSMKLLKKQKLSLNYIMMIFKKQLVLVQLDTAVLSELLKKWKQNLQKQFVLQVKGMN